MTRALARAFAHHDVVVAFGAREAISFLNRAGAFDAVVCDLMLPDELGFAVLHHLRATDPPLASRFALVTGGVLSADARDQMDEFDGLVLDKPFSLSQARGLLEELLAGR